MTKEELKQLIDAEVNTNGQRRISGEKLNDVLNEMVDTLSAGRPYGGYLTPNSSEPTDKSCFYIVDQTGLYFDSTVGVRTPGISILTWVGTAWNVQHIGGIPSVVIEVTQDGKLSRYEYNMLMAGSIKCIVAPDVNLENPTAFYYDSTDTNNGVHVFNAAVRNRRGRFSVFELKLNITETGAGFNAYHAYQITNEPL